MATSNAVWGIDIGQCSLKALRCSYDAKSQQLVADACEYIEYEKILSQPDANPDQLVRDAIKEFLSRNSVRGDGVAISVAGQQGLARFIKLPPVEAKKLPKIVEFEAKQQIPFALDDVIWDYQMLVGGVDADGMAMENEVGLFAMKREQVFRSIRPLDDVGIELDVIQLSPVCILNTAVHDVLGDVPPLSEYDPENPPPSIVILSMGTDTTDLVVTNGYRVWQRSIPLGGNHFTKQLTKELKLTFGKAEHLKKNSGEADDPKKVFQAMRPVFNDLVTEIQRSIGFFQSLDRQATIGHVVGLGNAFKLPGLEPYLEKNLGHKVQVLSKFERLSGAVLDDPKFKANAQSMGVCYGLALQGLAQSKLRTNLVPRELVTARMIRRKKPWVLAAASVLMAGLGLNYAMHSSRTSQVDEDRYSSYVSQVSAISSQSSQLKSEDDAKIQQFADLKVVGDQVIGNNDRRTQMLELIKAIETALPKEPGLQPGQPSQRKIVTDVGSEQRVDLFIETMDMKYFGTEDAAMSDWWDEAAQAAYAETKSMLRAVEEGGLNKPVETADGAEGDDPASDEDMESEDVAMEEEGDDDVGEEPGWVVELSGYHFHNLDPPMTGSEYVKRTLVRNLMIGKVRLPISDTEFAEFDMKELGISHALIAFDGKINREMKIPNPEWEPPQMEDDFGEMTAEDQRNKLFGDPNANKEKKPEVPQFLKPRTHKFKVHFLWRPTTLAQRLENRRQQAQGNATGDATEEGEN